MGLPPRSVVVPASVQDPVQQKAESHGRDAAQQQSARWMDTAMRPDVHGEPVQRKSAGEQREPIRSLPASGSGRPMPAHVQAKMEGAYATDLSAVRIHEGPRAAAMGALAYTQGTDIHFAPGQYDPGSQRGQEILGHELAHVVQQSEGRVTATAQARGVALNEDPSLEAEADRLGARAARGEAGVGPARVGLPRPGASAAAPVQRMTFARTQRGWLGSKVFGQIELNDKEEKLLELEREVREQLEALKSEDADPNQVSEFEVAVVEIEDMTVQEGDYSKIRKQLYALKREIKGAIQQTGKQFAREEKHAAMEDNLPGYLAELQDAEALVAATADYEWNDEQRPALERSKENIERLRALYNKIPDREDPGWFQRASGFESSLESRRGQGGLTDSVMLCKNEYELQLSGLRDEIAKSESQVQTKVLQGNEKVADIEVRLNSVEADHLELEDDNGAYQGGKELRESLYDQLGELRQHFEDADLLLGELIEQRNAMKDDNTHEGTRSLRLLEARSSKAAGILMQCKQRVSQIGEYQKRAKNLTKANTNDLHVYRRNRRKAQEKQHLEEQKRHTTSEETRVEKDGSSSPETVEFDGAVWHSIPPGNINLYGRITASDDEIGDAMDLYREALTSAGIISARSTGKSGVKKKRDMYEIKVRRTNLEAHGVPGDTRIRNTDIIQNEGKTYITFGAVESAH